MWKIRRILSDAVGIARVFGLSVAMKWLLSVARHFRQCIRLGNLQPADKAMGDGPYTARLGPSQAIMSGPGTIGGAREVWVRDVYLSRGTLKIPDNGVVVDLGSGAGNFSLLALGHGPGVRVVAVEAWPVAYKRLCDALAENKWTDRAHTYNCLLGDRTQWQDEHAKERQLESVANMTETEIIEDAGLHHIDLLKCDIEGSEFSLLKKDSRLLAITDQLAIELHAWGGDYDGFVQTVQELGFTILSRKDYSASSIILARRQ